MNIVAHLKGLLDGTTGAAYMGGSLCFDKYHMNTDGIIYWAGGQRQLTPKEHLLVCKVYLKYKTPKHHFYKRCKEIYYD